MVKRVVFKLIDFAKKKVPDFEWKDTKVQVFINAELAGKVTESERVLDECCLVLRSSGFLFRDDWASVLNGKFNFLFNLILRFFFIVGFRFDAIVYSITCVIDFNCITLPLFGRLSYR